MKNLAREPLVHFLLLGALIFSVNAWHTGGRPPEQAVPRIEVTGGTITWLREGFARQWRRPPAEDELRGLVTDHVREEVLYREALALGLDRNDTIVRRRMAQKMEFLGQDIAAAVEPDETALRAYFNEHAARYARAAQVSFRQVYFSREKRGDRLEADARAGLASLTMGADEETVGDPFLGEYEFTAADEAEIAAALGGGFAAQVMTLAADGWRGPVASSYGLHLVRVSGRAAPQAVELEAVREAVRRDFSDERRRAANEDFLRRLKERYLISVDETALNAAISSAHEAVQP